eukprot:c16494_g1_i1 orf=58-1050(+)
MALVRLPRYVAFQGNNNKLMLVSPTAKTPMLEFTADVEFLQRMAMVHEVHVVDATKGVVAIKYLTNGKFWQVSFDNPYRQDAIMANFDGVPGLSTTKALFLPVYVDKETVALKSLDTGRFCYRPGKDYFLPTKESMESSTKLVVKQPILASTLSNIVYDIDKAKIYSRRSIALVTQTTKNSSSLPGQVTLALEYAKSSTTSWSNSITTQLSVAVRMSAGAPRIAEGGIEISQSIAHAFTWGEETSESTTVTSTYTVPNVLPGATVRVTVSGEQANCDVPFSYTQIDTLPEGEQRTNNFMDGIFNGTNIFNIYIEATDVGTKKVVHRAALV